MRIRGNAHQIYEKYQQLARDAQASGDRIGAENLMQHGEHYYRMANVAGANGVDPRRGQQPPTNGHAVPESEDGSGQVADAENPAPAASDDQDEPEPQPA